MVAGMISCRDASEDMFYGGGEGGPTGDGTVLKVDISMYRHAVAGAQHGTASLLARSIVHTHTHACVIRDGFTLARRRRCRD